MRSQAVRAIASLSLLFAAAGCGEESRFFIVQNQVPEDGCVVPGDRSDVYRGEGRLDVSLIGDGQPHAYRMYPLLQNDLPLSDSKGAPQANRLVVKGFRVRVALAADAPTAARQMFDGLAADETGRRFLSYDEPWSATLDPGGDRLSAGLTAVPGEVARQLRASGVFEAVPRVNLLVGVRALGERQAGSLDSSEFLYPIEVCDGCLAVFAGSCPIATRQFAGNACNIAQDDLVDCCLEDGVARCPAPVKPTATMPPAAP